MEDGAIERRRYTLKNFRDELLGLRAELTDAGQPHLASAARFADQADTLMDTGRIDVDNLQHIDELMAAATEQKNIAEKAGRA